MTTKVDPWLEEIRVQQSKAIKSVALKGGAGSGNFGHAGRPGEVGGSADSDLGEPDTPYHGGGINRGSGRVQADKTFSLLGASEVNVTKVYWQDGTWRMEAKIPAQGNSSRNMEASLKANGFKRIAKDGESKTWLKKPNTGYYPRTEITIYRPGGTGGGQEYSCTVQAYLQLTD